MQSKLSLQQILTEAERQKNINSGIYLLHEKSMKQPLVITKNDTAESTTYLK